MKRPSKILNDLVVSATSAKAHFEVWWAQASETDPKLIRVMDRYSDFFNASYDAHYKTFFVCLAHLYDKRLDSSLIPTYLLAISATSDPLKLQAFQDKYANLAARATALLTVRHKVVAHIDARLSEKKVFGPLNITWIEVRNVIYDSATFVAELAGTTDLGSIGICRDARLIEATVEVMRALSAADA